VSAARFSYALRVRSLSILLLALAIVLFPAVSSGQVSTTGKIAGVVTDASGGVVANATVVAKSSALMSERIYHTQTDGSYLFDLLPPGTYTVTVTAQGFQGFQQDNVVITAGFTATVNPKMQLGQMQQVVRVESEPVVDVQNVQTSTTFDQSLLQEIPSGRDPWSTVAQMPGSTLSTFDVGGNNSYQQSTMQVHGSTPAEQVYSYNGLALNWPGANGGYTQFYTNHDSFDEFQVVTDNAPASVPIGGVYMNHETGHGSNKLHGQAALYYLTAGLQAGVKEPIYQGKPQPTASPFDMARDTSARLGGPVMRDRWWLFGSYRRYDLRQRILSVIDQNNSPVVDVNHQTNTDLRSDWQLNQKNKLSFIWLYNEQNRFFRRDTAYAFVSQQASWLQIEPAYILEGLWTSQITNNLLFDFRIGYNKIIFPLSYQPTVKPSDFNVQNVDTQTETGAAPYEFQNPAWAFRWSAGGSWYKSNLYGTHNFKFGFEYGDSYNSYIYKVNQGINVQISGGKSFVIAYNTPTTQKNYFHDPSFYVQDTWTLKRRLTLDIGMRFDHFVTFYPKQATDPNTTFPQLFNQQTFPASGNLVDWNTVSPRIGLAFDVTGKGDSVARFGYGRYYIMQGTGLAESANPVGLLTQIFPWTDTNGDGIPQQSEWLQGATPVGASGGANINKNMSRPYSEEISAGYEKQIWSDLRVGATYYYRTKKNMFGVENLAVQPSDYVPISTINGQPILNPITGKAMTLFSFQPTDQNKYGLFNFQITTIPLLDDNAYHALEFTAVKRLSHKLQVLGGFTIQRQKGAWGRGYSDQAFFDNFTDPNLDINRKNNYLNLDATYVFKIDGSYELPWKFSTSINFQHYTGFPLQPTESFPVPNGQGDPVSESVILQPAGVLRLPSVNMLNLRFARDFVFNERWHLKPTLDLFNLTNAQTVIGEVSTYAYGQPGGGGYLAPYLSVNPLVARFGLRFTF
jgi:Carboxypeptidase regulatory-like domain